MSYPIRHLVSRLSRRGRSARGSRRRSGSVLILVVALLVLMALIGTAWISTTRSDRSATQQHAANTEIDMLVDGVIAMAKSVLGEDLFGTAPPPVVPGQAVQYRPAAVPGVLEAEDRYEHYDFARPLSSGVATDRYLADRVPGRVGAGGAPGWGTISGALVPDSVGGTLLYPFEDVRDPATTGNNGRYVNRVNLQASSIVINGRTFPALVDGTTPPYLAADADGDGIADAGLFRLPVGQVNGVTYYAAIRIIDNNSAVNVNTAFSRDNDFDGAGVRLGNANFYRSHTFYTTRVGLLEMLTSYTGGAATRRIAMGEEFNNLQRLWWHDDSTPADSGSTSKYAPPGVLTGGTSPNAPVSDDPKLDRTDMRFISVGDAMSAMLGGRLYSPGYIVGGNSPVRYRAASPSDGAALAFAGGAVLPGDSSPTRLDLALSRSIYRRAGYANDNPQMRTLRYGADEVDTNGGWYRTLYDYAAAPDGPHIIRPLLVTSNPVSNAAPFHAMPDALMPPATGGASGVKTPPPPATEPTVRNAPTRAELAMLAPHLYPHLMPDTRVPIPGGGLAEATVNKASVNTAEFGELWRAYWMVMAQPNALPPITTQMFRSPLRDPYNQTAGPGNTVAATGTPQQALTARDTMLLRAALAAVNTMDLRDSDDDVTSMPIFLPETGNNAVVYGTERQPYITEVFVSTDITTPYPPGTAPNARGYVAVELYNPYPTPISLANWTLAIVDRRHRQDAPAGSLPSSYPSKPLIPLTRFLTGFGAAAAAPVIPANGRLILENYQDPAAVAGPYTSLPGQDAQGRPTSAMILPGPTVPTFFVPGLAEVIRSTAVAPAGPGGELVLLRPRLANGTFSTRFNPIRNVTEIEGLVTAGGGATETGPRNMVPVDSFDFHGHTIDEATAGIYTVYHYVRRNGDTGADQWRMVYPGQWHSVHPWNTALPYRQEGVVEAQFGPAVGGTPDPWGVAGATPPITLGAASPGAAGASYVNYFPPIQLNNVNWAGPSKLTPAVAGGNRYPFGAFARNGDILQVPFIGAYRILQPGTIPGAVFELNPVTADAGRADDADTWTKTGEGTPTESWAATPVAGTDDPHEMVGRFCPIRASAGASPNPPLPATTVTNYGWADDLFDYLTVQSPQADLTPNVYPPDYNTAGSLAGIEPQPTSVNNVDPSRLPDVVWGRVADSAGPRITAVTGLPNVPAAEYNRSAKYIVFMMADGTTQFRSVGKFTISPPSGGKHRVSFIIDKTVTGLVDMQTPFKLLCGTGNTERTLGVEGLVNINTAPLKVLEQLPWVVQASTGRTIPNLNRQMAQQIITQRQTTPFKSLFDLNQVSVAANQTFQNMMGRMPAEPTVGEGEYTPDTIPSELATAAGSPPAEPADFESRFLMINRMSNLITTRSDTFTCYVLVQGWRGAGSANPELVVQRRRAFIADRTGVTPTSREIATQFFYNE